MEVLTVDRLETNDPDAPTRSHERRFLCPFPACADHQNPRRHRSLSLNVDTGLYRCHRCGAVGKAQEYWEERARNSKAQARERLGKAFELRAPMERQVETLEHADQLGVPIMDSLEGLAYLSRRGIPEYLAAAVGLRFIITRAGWPAVLFPMQNEHGAFVAGHARSIEGNEKKTKGPKSEALFVPPGALERGLIIITEGPFDALSLTLCGYPAVALVGTTAPRWIRRHVYGKRVLIATDADEAGDLAAVALTLELSSFGGTVRRLRPRDGMKDWNEALMKHGAADLSLDLEWMTL